MQWRHLVKETQIIRMKSTRVVQLERRLVPSGGDLAPSLGGRKNFSRTKIFWKISIFTAKISDDLFLVIDQVFFRIFSFFSQIFRILIYYVKCLIRPFPHKKNTFFYSIHTFARNQQHYFSKYWEGRMHRPSPTSNFGGPSLQSP